jgi:hypothetical protein
MSAHKALVRALLDGGPGVVATSSVTPWASITFEGERHSIVLRLPPEQADMLCAGLAERVFTLPGHLVADISAARHDDPGQASSVVVEALTIAER